MKSILGIKKNDNLQTSACTWNTFCLYLIRGKKPRSLIAVLILVGLTGFYVWLDWFTHLSNSGARPPPPDFTSKRTFFSHTCLKVLMPPPPPMTASAGGVTFSGCPSVRHILVNPISQERLEGIPQIWNKRPLGLKDELSRIKRRVELPWFRICSFFTAASIFEAFSTVMALLAKHVTHTKILTQWTL